MKKLIFVFMLLAVLHVSAEKIKNIVEPKISDVRIFQSGAQVNRSFKTNIDPGSTQLVIEGLSSSIDPNSITISLDGDAMILSTNYLIDYLKEKKVSPTIKL